MIVRSASTIAIVLTMAAAAHADNSAKTHDEYTDNAGTSVTVDTSHKDADTLLGGHKTTDEAKRVTDPKGLGNSTTEKAREEKRVASNGDVKTEKRVIRKDGTEERTADSTKTRQHANGSVTTTKSHTDVRDPKGLLNKKKATSEEAVTRNADGSVRVTKEENGKVVSDTTNR